MERKERERKYPISLLSSLIESEMAVSIAKG